jgi:hypothetical protein
MKPVARRELQQPVLHAHDLVDRASIPASAPITIA